jgi:hypothetical protein
MTNDTLTDAFSVMLKTGSIFELRTSRMRRLHTGNNNKATCSFGRLLFLCVTVLCFILAGTGCKHTPPDTSTFDPVESAPYWYIGKIVATAPRDATAEPVLRVWRLEAEVVSIGDSTANVAPPIGSHVVFFVHSIVRTFNLDRDAVIGKTFRIEYAGGFANPYDGSVNVKSVPVNGRPH